MPHTFWYLILAACRVDEDENEELEPVKETPLRQLLDAASRHGGGGGKKGGAPSLHCLSYGELVKIGKQARLTRNGILGHQFNKRLESFDPWRIF
jgi:hypothetical protein